MRTLARIAAVVLAALIALTVAASPATAKTFEQWRFRHPQICVKDAGGVAWPVVEAVAAWNASRAVMLDYDADCAGYAASQVITVTTYDDPAEYACAKTASPSGYDWAYVYFPDGSRKASWTPRDMTIWLNVAEEWAAQCTATAGHRAHIIAHEIGHGIGVGHPEDHSVVSVMDDWTITAPTAWDLANVRTAYGVPATPTAPLSWMQSARQRIAEAQR